MTWEDRINKLVADWQAAMNRHYRPNEAEKTLNEFYLMPSGNDFRLILKGIAEGDLDLVRQGIEEAKIMFPFIKEMLTIRDSYPGGYTAYLQVRENSASKLEIDMHKGRFLSPELTWKGKSDKASILLELSRLINNGARMCMKHPRHQKV